jgi:hypothetical protein
VSQQSVTYFLRLVCSGQERRRSDGSGCGSKVVWSIGKRRGREIVFFRRYVLRMKPSTMICTVICP